MAIRLQESDMVIPGCVHSHEIPKKKHLLSLSQACQAKLGMTTRVRDGSITLDDYDTQSLEVVRQVRTGLFVIRIDNLKNNDYVRDPLLDDLVIDFDDERGIDSMARDSDQTNSSIASHMRWSMIAVARFREMCSRPILLSWAADTRTSCRKFDEWSPFWNPGKTTRNMTVYTKVCIGSSPTRTSFDHDLQDRTTSLCCERRDVVEHVSPLQSTSALRFLVAPIWAGFQEKYVRRELFGMQQTVTHSCASTKRTGPSRVFTTCSCARPGDRPLETTTTGKCGRPRTTSKRQVPRLHLSRRARVAEPCRATRKLQWKRTRTRQLSAETRRPPQDRSEHDRRGQVHVSQIFWGGKGRLGSSDATVTRRSLYRDQAEQATMFAYCDIETESLSSSRGIERKICTSRVNRNAIAAIFSQDTGASYRRWSSEAARVVGTSVKPWRMDTRIPNDVVHHDDFELALRRGGEEGQDSKFSDVQWTWIRRLERRQAVSWLEVQPLGDSN